MNTIEFGEELKRRRSVDVAKDLKLKKKDVLSESCLGLCVE